MEGEACPVWEQGRSRAARVARRNNGLPPPPASARRTQGWVVPWNCSASVEPARATVADAPRVTASTTASK